MGEKVGIIIMKHKHLKYTDNNYTLWNERIIQLCL